MSLVSFNGNPADLIRIKKADDSVCELANKLGELGFITRGRQRDELDIRLWMRILEIGELVRTGEIE